MTSVVTFSTEIPAVRAAAGFRPVARNSNPIVERSSSHHTNSAAARAAMNPKCTRKESPSSLGYIAVSRTGMDFGFVFPSPMNEGRVRTYPISKPAIELSMIVVMTSFAPVFAFRMPQFRTTVHRRGRLRTWLPASESRVAGARRIPRSCRRLHRARPAPAHRC